MVSIWFLRFLFINKFKKLFVNVWKLVFLLSFVKIFFFFFVMMVGLVKKFVMLVFVLMYASSVFISACICSSASEDLYALMSVVV